MTRPPLAVLMLLSCAIPMSRWTPFTVVKATWLERPESQFAERMALFEHVLLNDARWSLVLKQTVKLSALNLPQYPETSSNTEFLAKIRLVDKDVTEITVKKVLQNLMNKSPRLGTNVNLSAYVLSTGVTCFTYTNVSFMLSLVNRIAYLVRRDRRKNYDEKKEEKTDEKKEENTDEKKEEKTDEKKEENTDEKKEENTDEKKEEKTVKQTDGSSDGSSDDSDDDNDDGDTVDEALDNARMTFEVFVDKVAAVNGELAVLASGLLDYDGAEKTDDDLVQLIVLSMMKEEVDEMIAQYCNPATDAEVYQYLGKYESLTIPPEGEPLPDATLEHELLEFNKVVNSMIEIYDELDVETMPMYTWIQILDYKVPISKKIKFYIHGKQKDPIKSRLEQSMTERLKRASSIAQKEEKKEEKKAKKKRKGKNKRGKKHKRTYN